MDDTTLSRKRLQPVVERIGGAVRRNEPLVIEDEALKIVYAVLKHRLDKIMGKLPKVATRKERLPKLLSILDANKEYSTAELKALGFTRNLIHYAWHSGYLQRVKGKKREVCVEKRGYRYKYYVRYKLREETVSMKFERIAVKYGMTLGENAEDVIAALDGKLEAYGKRYCPCVPPTEHSNDTVCPCINLRKHKDCQCGLFVNPN